MPGMGFFYGFSASPFAPLGGVAPPPPPPSATYTLSGTPTLAEGNSGTTNFVHTLTRGGNTTIASTVDWAVTGQGANPANAADFVGGVFPSGQFSFAIGETVKTSNVAVAGDVTAEMTENYLFTVSNPVPAGTIVTATAIGTITDDDTVSVPTASFTMTQLPIANRIYPRTSKADGGQGKGQGTIPVTISSATAGTINARCRAADGVTIIQDEFAAATIAGGATTANIAGVDARLNQFYLDTKGSDGVWKNGATLIGMGALVGIAGQSHTSSQFINNTDAADSSTISGNGLALNAAMRAFVAVDGGGSDAASVWRQPSDAGALNSTGVVELTNRLISALGVAVGIVGKTQGNTAVSAWQTGQNASIGLLATLAAAGGKIEAFIFGIGHNDAGFNTAKFDALKTQIGAFWASVDGAVSGTYKKIMFGVPNTTNNSYNTTMASRAKVNGAFEDWAAENNGTYLPVPDIFLGADNIHATQAGNTRYAQHEYRALRTVFGLTEDDRGPKITGISKSGVNITLTVEHQAGATTLVSQGSPAGRFWVGKRGAPTALALDAVTPITVNASSIVLKLAADPGNIPIEVFPLAVHPSNNAAADMIYDDNTDGDGITRGRTLYASPWGFDTSPVLDGIAVTPTYNTTTKFGGGMSAGYIDTAFAAVPHEARGSTIECFYKHLVNDGSHRMIFSQPDCFWLSVNTSQLTINGSSIGPTLTIGQTYHIALVNMPGDRNAVLYVNGVGIAIDGGVLTSDAGRGFSIRRFGTNGFELSNIGEVAHVAIFRGPRYLANFVPTTTAYTGTEPDLLHLWKLDGNALDGAV